MDSHITIFSESYFSGHRDFLGITLNACVTALAIYPITSIFFIYEGLDPLYLLAKYMIFSSRSNSQFVIIVTLFRLLIIISFIQICRLFALIFCAITVLCHVVLSCINWMTRTSRKLIFGRDSARRILLGHDKLQIIIQNVQTEISSLQAVVLLTGLVLSICFNFVTIKMYHVIPMPLYLFFPAVGITIPIIIQIMLPMLIDVYEEGVVLDWRWRCTLLATKDRKHLKKKLKGIKILRLYAGLNDHLFFFTKMSTKSMYYYTILSYTISSLLSMQVGVGYFN